MSYKLLQENSGIKLIKDGVESIIPMDEANTDIKLAGHIGKLFDESEQAGRDRAVANGNSFFTMADADVAAWKTSTRPVVDSWIKDMKDGQRLFDKANALIRTAASAWSHTDLIAASSDTADGS